MKKLLTIICAVLVCGIVLQGCGGRSRNGNRMQSTVMDDGYYSSDYCDGCNTCGDFSEGLAPRNEASCEASSCEAVCNLIASAHFDFDSSAIKESERSKFEPVLDYLKCDCNHRILIVGHCDWFGTAEYNLALGDRRAKSAETYLVHLGASPSQITTVSKGSLDATQGLTKAEGIKDRRVDMYKVNQ